VSVVHWRDRWNIPEYPGRRGPDSGRPLESFLVGFGWIWLDLVGFGWIRVGFGLDRRAGKIMGRRVLDFELAVKSVSKLKNE
jgi:hypothetical protein